MLIQAVKYLNLLKMKNQNNNFISIISPVKNEKKHITQCLYSLLNQNYSHEKYEILIIDGMSDDGTREIVQQIQKKYDNIRLLDNPRKIIPAALNIGIKHAKGDIIVRVDGHSFIEENYLNKCLKLIRDTKAECVGGVIESINSSRQGKAIALAMSTSFGVGNARFRTSGKAGYVDTLAFGAYRKEVFQKYGFFKEDLLYSEDDEFNYRLRKNGGNIFLSPEIKAYYYSRDSIVNLWKQYFRYGYWKVRVLQKHPSMMQYRHFVPPLFIFSLTGSLLLGLSYPPMLIIFFIIFSIYILVNLLFSTSIAFKHGFRYLPLLPIIFATLHMSYGLGFLVGLVRFLPYWFKDE